MISSRKLHIRGSQGPLHYEVTIDGAVAEDTAHGSHVFVEFLQGMILNADISFWEKFEDEMSPEGFFSATLKALARAWVYQYWDREDDGDFETISFHRVIDEMLIHLNKTGHLPEKFDNPREDDDEPSDGEPGLGPRN